MPDLYTFYTFVFYRSAPVFEKVGFPSSNESRCIYGGAISVESHRKRTPKPEKLDFFDTKPIYSLIYSIGWSPVRRPFPSDVPSRPPAIQSLFVSDWPRRIAGRQHGLDDCARLVQCFFAARSNVFACRDSSDFARGLRHGGQFDAGGHIRSVVPGHGHVFQTAHRAVRFQEQDTYNPFCAVEVCFDVDVPHDGCILSLY